VKGYTNLDAPRPFLQDRWGDFLRCYSEPIQRTLSTNTVIEVSSIANANDKGRTNNIRAA